ncbi:MAG: SIR2 family NAD-dependent protein deacylase [Phycisphaerales bacterium]
MSNNLLSAAAALAKARHVVVITGAGVSAESGIRTFRDTMEGLWKEFDPVRLATPEAFAADPETVTRWYDWRRLGCLAAEPNPGHLALARLEHRLTETGRAFTLLTQNVDRLHHKAGSRNVVELHGSIIQWRCSRTGRTLTPPPEPFTALPPAPPFAPGASLRPDVVWFGEALPRHALDAAEQAVLTCDLFMSVGTSSVVYPAAGFAELARLRGATVIEVNPAPTALTSIADWSLRGKSGEILPDLLHAAMA